MSDLSNSDRPVAGKEMSLAAFADDASRIFTGVFHALSGTTTYKNDSSSSFSSSYSAFLRGRGRFSSESPTPLNTAGVRGVMWGRKCGVRRAFPTHHQHGLSQHRSWCVQEANAPYLKSMRPWFSCVAAEVTRRKSADPPPHVGGYGQDLRGRYVIFLGENI